MIDTRSGSTDPARDDELNALPLVEMPYSKDESSTSRPSTLHDLRSSISGLLSSSTGDFKSPKIPRRVLYLILATVAGLFLFLFRGRVTSTVGEVSKSFHSDDPSKHPIEILVGNREIEWEKMKARQSETLAQASEEYRKRYGRRPPSGFPRWFALAKERDHILVDEYDVLMEDMEPFWGVAPHTLAARMYSRFTNDGGTSMATFSSDGIEYALDVWHNAVIQKWMDNMPWKEMISNVTVLIDVMDEAGVSVPLSTVKDALKIAAQQRSSVGGVLSEVPEGDEDVYVHNFSKQNVWEFLLDTCAPDDPVRKPSISDVSKDSVSFISNPRESEDVCLNPFIHANYGLYLSPSNLLLSKHLLPSLHIGRPYRFNDVRYPAPFYSEKLDEEAINFPEGNTLDSAWEDKLDQVYWVGTNLGGITTPKNWRNMQRQRMAIITRPDSAASVSLLQRSTSSASHIWTSYTKTWGDMSAYFHVRIAAVESCRDGGCEEQEAYFQPAREDVAASFGSKYCLDLDGMGFSGRFLRLLRSNCAVLKQTVIEEWSDKWLVPWVHYIPVSIEAGELPEITRFLIEEPEGREIGAKIARQGREWSRRVMRKVDMELYFMRLLMEMERVLSPERNHMFYSG